MIKNIEISKINPHPDNPRKDLGDLTELADSIKKNGVFQNLTVVPWFSQVTGVGADDPKQQEEMGYIVVIGHRRLAAAKLAGLTKVPCEISKMGYSEQISTMLLENMQRCDLTVYEQAQGFQMLLNLGESVNDIAQSTGFSETTVRRRVKLLDLDAEKFKKSVERGGTLLDYIELDKIKNIDTKNKVLEAIGTNNFSFELSRAFSAEKTQKNKELIIIELKKFAKETDNTQGILTYVAYYDPSISGKEAVKIPDDVKTTEYFFSLASYNECITLYKEIDKRIETEDQTTADAERKNRDIIRAKLKEVTDIAYKLRFKFVQNITNATAKKHINKIVQFLMKNFLLDEINLCYNQKLLQKFFNIDINEDEDEEEEATVARIIEQITAKPENQLLAIAYLNIEDSDNSYYTWRNDFTQNKKLDELYEFLKIFGYKMSDEEIALKNGTHELFTKPDKEE